MRRRLQTQGGYRQGRQRAMADAAVAILRETRAMVDAVRLPLGTRCPTNGRRARRP